MPDQKRQLAAIMFTDIVGYTRLMGKDSKKAMELVRQSISIQKPLVEKHNGKWLKEMGDGAMAQFSSALDAVNCALEIQRTSRADFEADLRIGIHLGDITVDNNDVYGDGVNVASRLESIADPGGIYISESIEKAIRGQSDVQAKYIGEVNLKNVDYGVRTYALQGVGLPVPNLKNDKQLSGRFYAEVKRRGVIRAATVYVLISLLLILLQPFVATWISLPTSFKTGLLAVLVIGFPIAVLLAWRYERSPEGFVRSTSDKSWQNPLNASQRKPFTGNMVTWGLAMVIIGLLMYNNLNQENTVIDQDVSLAILPFRNNSGNDDLSHYGIGMATEVRSKLSYTKKFDFISATQSTLGYANTNASPIEIGADLRVGYILTGMFQIVGDRIKVDVEMVDTQTGRGIWDQSFNELFTDIFEVQSKIADEVMKGFSFDQKLEDEVLTKNMEAYGQYLLGTEKTFEYKDLNIEAMDYFISAIQLDSGFIDAWVELIALETWWLLVIDQDFDLESEQTTAVKDSVLIEVEKQLAEVNKRAPDSWKNTLVQGYYSYYGIREYDKAVQLFNEVLVHDPENTNANSMLAGIYKRKLLHQESVSYNLTAARQNPKAPTNWDNISRTMENMGDYESSRKAAQKVNELGYGPGRLFHLNYIEGIVSPLEFTVSPRNHIDNKFLQRDFSGILTFVDQVQLELFTKYCFKAKCYFLINNLDSSRHYASLAVERTDDTQFRGLLPMMYAILGNREKAMKLIKNKIDENLRIGDYNMACNNYVREIDLLCIFGDYKMATEKLLALNKNYPQWGDYAAFYHLPEYDKIKQEYPPFLEALNNLKLPMKLKLDAMEVL